MNTLYTLKIRPLVLMFLQRNRTARAKALKPDTVSSVLMSHRESRMTQPLVQARPIFLPFSPPAITEDEIAAVVDTLRSAWITTGPKTRQFEQEFARYLGAESALALN